MDHDPSFFKVRFGKASNVTDLGAMPSRNVHRIWKALTSAQRKKAQELGHNALANSVLLHSDTASFNVMQTKQAILLEINYVSGAHCMQLRGGYDGRSNSTFAQCRAV